MHRFYEKVTEEYLEELINFVKNQIEISKTDIRRLEEIARRNDMRFGRFEQTVKHTLNLVKGLEDYEVKFIDTLKIVDENFDFFRKLANMTLFVQRIKKVWEKANNATGKNIPFVTIVKVLVENKRKSTKGIIGIIVSRIRTRGRY